MRSAESEMGLAAIKLDTFKLDRLLWPLCVPFSDRDAVNFNHMVVVSN